MNPLRTLLAAGLTLRTDGDRLLVTPISALTESLRELIRRHKPELWAAVGAAEVLTADLIAAINRCCDARGDDAESRGGLIRECLALPPAMQADAREHFDEQAALWWRVTGQYPDARASEFAGRNQE